MPDKEVINNMAIHPSLSLTDKDRKPRSVLKRIERLKVLVDKNKWTEKDSVYGLPKLKSIRIRIKKEKAEKAVEATAAGEAQAAAPAAGEPAAKGPAAKTQEKK